MVMFRVHYQSPLTLTSHIDINLMVSENKLHIPESPQTKNAVYSHEKR